MHYRVNRFLRYWRSNRLKPYLRFRGVYYQTKEILAEALCVVALLFGMGVLSGACLDMLDNFRSSENILDSLNRTAEQP